MYCNAIAQFTDFLNQGKAIEQIPAYEQHAVKEAYEEAYYQMADLDKHIELALVNAYKAFASALPEANALDQTQQLHDQFYDLISDNYSQQRRTVSEYDGRPLVMLKGLRAILESWGAIEACENKQSVEGVEA